MGAHSLRHRGSIPSKRLRCSNAKKLTTVCVPNCGDFGENEDIESSNERTYSSPTHAEALIERERTFMQ